MPEQVPFINRENELAQIEELIEKWDTWSVLCINAPGGVGKTRLLQEVYKRYTSSKQTRLIVTDIIDFNNPTFHIMQNVGREIAKMLDENRFEPYLRALLDRRKMQEIGVSPEQLAQASLAIDLAFVDCFNKIADQQRIVLFMDTTDAIEGMAVQDYVAGVGAQLKNGVLLIAGRNARSIGKAIQIELGEKIQIIDLEPLQEEASESYLQQKQKLLHISLEPELSQKLLFLAGGRPIMIDLAVDLLSREIPLEWLAESSLEEMKLLSKQQMQERQQEFERRLVHHIADTRRPMDWLILVMSRVYPLDPEMIGKLLSISKDEATSLFQDAQNYVFVKELPDGRISLHDEMRRMINDYVWPEVDPDGDRQRRDSKLAAKYLKREIETLTKRIEELEAEEKTARKEEDAQTELSAFMEREPLERELWVLKERRLGHMLFMNVNEGVKTFSDIFDEATQAYRYAFRKTLLTHMQKYIDQLSPEQKYEVDIRQVKSLIDDGEHPEARELLWKISISTDFQPEQQINIPELLRKISISTNLRPEQKVDTLNQWANVEIRLGKLLDGIKFFEKAVEISKKHDLKEWLMKAETGLGWAYRLTDDFKKADKHYKVALNLARQIGSEQQQVLLYNNRGFAYAYFAGIPDRREKAVWFCHQALSLAKKLGNKREQGMCYSNMGCITYMDGKFNQAWSYFQKALEIFEPVNDREWLSTVYSWRGSLHMAQGNATDAEKDLSKSLDMNIQKDRPLNLARLAHIYISKGELDKAQKAIDECRRLALDLPDVLYQQVSLRDMARLAFVKGEYNRREEFERLLTDYREKWGEPKNLRALGMLHLNLGRLALGKSDLTTAIEHFKPGLELLAREGHYANNTPEDYVKSLEQDMVAKLQLSSKQIREIGSELLSFWQEKALDDNHPDIWLRFSNWVT